MLLEHPTVDWRVGSQGLLHLGLCSGDLPTADTPFQILRDYSGNAIGGLVVGRSQARFEAALLAAASAEVVDVG